MLDGINLMARKGTVADVMECYALHKSLRLPYTKRNWRILPEMWRTLLSIGAMQLCLVADRAKLVGSRIVSFSEALFVTDEFCSEARSKLPPYLGVELARQYLSRELPALSREQVAQANAGDGLNVLMCFEGCAHYGLSPEQVLAVREKQSEALHLALSGYRVKEFLADPLGEETLEWMLNAGARLRRDYSNYFRNNAVFQPKSSQRPCLIGLTKKEAFAHPGSDVARLFIYTPPRFHFSRSQRVLLQRALTGETCEMLAASLSISSWTVKKRWHAIYERVADVDSELLQAPIANGVAASSRGAERRRHLLNYLRQHSEELRPFKVAPRRRQTGRAFLSAVKIFVAGTAFGADWVPSLFACLS
jgi:DNA-binding NarL/FixJ family response regulator